MNEQQQHPITPPPELVQEWAHEHQSIVDGSMYVDEYIATQTARYRQIADAELEACVEWFVCDWTDIETADKLCAARRPKPLSLAKEALDARKRIWNGYSTHADWKLIDAALERLQELEDANG